MKIVINRPRIPVKELTDSLEGYWTASPPQQLRSVTIDSRKTDAGSLFAALEGSSTHGHEYLAAAKEAGATAAVVESPQDSSLPQFVVPNSDATLNKLARRYRVKHMDAFRIGITGTCGKTTLKTMLADILSESYLTGRTPGNFNNQLGLPLTMLNQGHGEVLVAELGTNAPGEISTLSRWLKPNMGIITHIGPAHLEGLKNVEQVAEEKSDLFSFVAPDGFCLAPGGLEYDEILERKASSSVVFVERGMTEPFRLDWSRGEGSSRLRFENVEIQLDFTGEGLVRDAALAACAAGLLGIDESVIKHHLEAFRPLGGRGQIKTFGNCRVIDGTYNANPDSVRTALQRISDMPAPRLVVLGDMKELGNVSKDLHRSMANKVNTLSDTDVVFVGDYYESFREGLDRANVELTAVASFEELDPPELQDYRSCLVKGSNDVGLEQLLDEWVESS